MSAAEFTCLCGWKVRIEAGPDAFRNAAMVAQECFHIHATGCRVFSAKNKRVDLGDKAKSVD